MVTFLPNQKYQNKTNFAIQKNISAPTDFFESNVDGNWNNAASWKSSSVSSSGPWTIPATSIPTSSAQGIVIKDTITIQSGASETAALLVIANGGYLNHTSNGILSLLDDGSSVIDFLIQSGGVYELHGSQPVYVNGSTVQIENGGIVRAKSNSGGESDNFAMQSNVFFQTGAIMEWNTSQPFQTGNVTYFPNASSSDHPIFRITSSPSSALGANSNTTFNGKFEVDAGHTFTFKSKGEKIFRDGLGGNGILIHSTDISFPCGPFKITGANAVIDGSLNVQLGNNSLNTNELEITNGAFVTISSPNVQIGTLSNPGSSFLIDGTLNISSGNSINISKGHLILNGKIAASSLGTFSAGSSVASSVKIEIGGINGTAGILNFTPGFEFIDSFSINRTGISAPRIELGSDMNANEFVFTSGKIITGNHLITWNNTGTTSAGNSSSYFATCTVTSESDEKGTPLSFTLPFPGNVGVRILNVNNNVPIYFPVGPNLISYNKIFLQNGSTLTNNPFTVSVAIGDIGNTPLPRVNRIWYIKENNPGTSTADMRLYFTKHSNTSGFPVTQDEVEFGFDYNDCHLIQETYVNQFIHNSNGADIMQHAGAADLSEIYAKYTRGVSFGLDGNNDGIDTFSRFAIVNAQGIILPVKIIDFNILRIKNEVEISWRCSDEKNILLYDLERSGDGKNFTTITTIRPPENVTHENPYFFTDSFPFEGKNYYRLKIEESNGEIKYADIKEIWIDKLINEIDVYPNPLPSNSSVLHFKCLNLPSGNYELFLLDVSGKIIFEKKLIFNSGSNLIWKINKQLLPGMYFLQIRDKNIIRTKSLIVQ